MTINNIITRITKKLDSQTWTETISMTLFGVLLVTPVSFYYIGPYIFGSLFTNIGLIGMLSKLTSTVGGLGAGWHINDYWKTQNLDFNKIIYNPDIWKHVYDKIEIEKINCDNLSQESRITLAMEYLSNTETQIGALYYFVNLVFIERFGFLESNKKINIMEEVKQIVDLLCDKHPFYPDGLDRNILSLSINNKLLGDLGGYISFYYSLNNYENNKLFFNQYNDNDNDISLVDRFFQQETGLVKYKKEIIDIIDTASLVFCTLPITSSIEEKTSILNKTIKIIDDDFKENLGKNLGCDDLLPILVLLVLLNWNIFPSNDINMIYDYLQDNNDKEGYISTLMMSAVFSSVQFTKNIKLN